ncbi:uncharacterized protein LOC133360765 [Lethenteron reissneri]|uniref:uncharacterized protein LOC133360765 n=1 Tax=Lethenteron reissneri TaxID=7753 RepID=UPI002AB7BFB0|nr:uncharacterized protein LOC133360765 [Lethenteron reissneri]
MAGSSDDDNDVEGIKIYRSRGVVVKITNNTKFTLGDARYYMESGTHKAFPKTPINPDGQGLYGFHKKIGLSGCHGTMTLRFSGHDHCLKIFFKNMPGAGPKSFSVCVENDPVYDIGLRTHNEMIRNQISPSSTFSQAPAGNEVSVTNEELMVRARASMSEQKRAVIFLTVESMMPKPLSPFAPPQVEEEETQGHSHDQMAHARPGTELVVYKGKTVEAILAGMSTNIKVAIEISNKSKYTLHKQSCFLDAGVEEYSPHSEIISGEKRACGFRKLNMSLKGCYGVLRYCIKDNSKCLDIMFSNPYSSGVFSREVAIQLQDLANVAAPSARLLTEMYNSKVTEDTFDKKGAGDSNAVVEDKKELNIKVTANMQDSAESIVRIELTDIPHAKQIIVKSSPAISE